MPFPQCAEVPNVTTCSHFRQELCPLHLHMFYTFIIILVLSHITKEEKHTNDQPALLSIRRQMEDNNLTPTSIISENATTMSEMNDSIAMMNNNNPPSQI